MLKPVKVRLVLSNLFEEILILQKISFQRYEFLLRPFQFWKPVKNRKTLPACPAVLEQPYLSTFYKRQASRYTEALSLNQLRFYFSKNIYLSAFKNCGHCDSLHFSQSISYVLIYLLKQKCFLAHGG